MLFRSRRVCKNIPCNPATPSDGGRTTRTAAMVHLVHQMVHLVHPPDVASGRAFAQSLAHPGQRVLPFLSGLQFAGSGVKRLTAPAGECGHAPWCGSPNDQIGGGVADVRPGRILVLIDVAVSARLSRHFAFSRWRRAQNWAVLKRRPGCCTPTARCSTQIGRAHV